MNGLARELIENEWVDTAYVEQHTCGYDAFCKVVEDYPPKRVADICGVSGDDVRRAAEIFGTSERIVSTVLQGFYQSHQATAASCMVNNLHLLRGMLGSPGRGLLQMNGQPTAQNNRECGANGDLPGFRNWENPAHVEQLAQIWNVDPTVIPHWAPPTHAMQPSGTSNRARSGLVDLRHESGCVAAAAERIRRVLGGKVFLVVQDLYLTETARLADVVLPAAGWGEKTGTFTNAERTVHLSEQAVDPPGEARSDLAIFLDYSARMGFVDQDGERLLPWSEPEEVFDAWRERSRGRPCDYSGLSYDSFGPPAGCSGRSHPGNLRAPHACTSMESSRPSPTTRRPSVMTSSLGRRWAPRRIGPSLPRGGRSSRRRSGHRRTKSPIRTTRSLSTGRTVHHFHSRTKTARASRLNSAAPDVWVEPDTRRRRRYGC